MMKAVFKELLSPNGRSPAQSVADASTTTSQSATASSTTSRAFTTMRPRLFPLPFHLLARLLPLFLFLGDNFFYFAAASADKFEWFRCDACRATFFQLHKRVTELGSSATGAKSVEKMKGYEFLELLEEICSEKYFSTRTYGVKQHEGKYYLFGPGIVDHLGPDEGFGQMGMGDYDQRLVSYCNMFVEKVGEDRLRELAVGVLGAEGRGSALDKEVLCKSECAINMSGASDPEEARLADAEREKPAATSAGGGKSAGRKRRRKPKGASGGATTGGKTTEDSSNGASPGGEADSDSSSSSSAAGRSGGDAGSPPSDPPRPRKAKRPKKTRKKPEAKRDAAEEEVRANAAGQKTPTAPPGDSTTSSSSRSSTTSAPTVEQILGSLPQFSTEELQKLAGSLTSEFARRATVAGQTSSSTPGAPAAPSAEL